MSLLLLLLGSPALAAEVTWNSTPAQILARPPGGGTCAPYDEPRIKVTCAEAGWFGLPASTSFEFVDDTLKGVTVRFGPLGESAFRSVMDQLTKESGTAPVVSVRGTWDEQTLTQWSVGPHVTVFEQVGSTGPEIHFVLVSFSPDRPE